MKYNGQPLKALATQKVVVPRLDGNHLEFVVRALTYGEEAEIADLFPDVEAPYGDILKENKLPLLDDEGKVVKGYLYDDPGYIRAQNEVEDLRVVMRIVKCLDRDRNVEWGSTEPRTSQKFYRDVYNEIREAGLSFGDLALVHRAAQQLANVDADVLERAAEAFSQRERKAN